jgi:hypothetical protein
MGLSKECAFSLIKNYGRGLLTYICMPNVVFSVIWVSEFGETGVPVCVHFPSTQRNAVFF